MGANGSLRSLSHCDDTAVSGQQTTDRTAEAASNWSSWSTHSFADNVDAPLFCGSTILGGFAVPVTWVSCCGWS